MVTATLHFIKPLKNTTYNPCINGSKKRPSPKKYVFFGHTTEKFIKDLIYGFCLFNGNALFCLKQSLLYPMTNSLLKMLF